MYWAFIVNPTAGTGYALKAMDRLEELLRSKDIEYKVCVIYYFEP